MKALMFLILVILNAVHCDPDRRYSYCGHDRYQTDKKPTLAGTNVSPGTKFEQIRIKADLSAFTTTLVGRKDKIEKAFQSACETMQKLVRVQRFSSVSITKSVGDKQNEISNFNSNDFNSYDLVVYLMSDTTIGDSVTLGRPTILYGKNKRPVTGVIKVNSWVNVDYQTNAHYFFHDQFLHALTHIMVFSDKLYEHYPTNKNPYEKENLLGVDKYFIKSPKVMTYLREHYNCYSNEPDYQIKGLELGKPEVEGLIGSHWEGRIMLGDLMIEAAYQENALSKMTLGLFEDSGWYQVNYYTGGLFRFGKNQGCAFLKRTCVDTDTDKARFKNDFISKPGKNQEVCTASRMSAGYGSIKDYPYGFFSPEEKRTAIFASWNIGGWEGAGYCPVAYDRPTDLKNLMDNIIKSYESYDYYYSSCKVGIPNSYGSLVLQANSNDTEKSFKGFFKNTYGDHSFCALSKVTERPVFASNPVSIFEYLLTPPYRAICLEMFCSATQLTIKAGKNYIVCPVQGGIVKLPNEEGEIVCPDYNLICTGQKEGTTSETQTDVCNFITDCVDKKIVEKPNTHNYVSYPTGQSETTQESSTLDGLVPVESFEESKDGKCGEHCSWCTEVEGSDKTVCQQCGKGFTKYSPDENSAGVECILTTTCETGPYYFKNGVCYPCTENCAFCKNDQECLRCNEGYFQECIEGKTYGVCKKEEILFKDQNTANGNLVYYYDDNKQCYEKCEKTTPNCLSCADSKVCKICKPGFAMLDFDKTKCIEEDKLKTDEYYKHDDVGPNYRSCSKNDVANCAKCTNNKDCTACQDNYCLLDGGTKKCYLQKDLLDTGKIFKEDKGKCSTCSLKIENCEYCEELGTCKKCLYGFCAIENDRTKCSDITNGEYWYKAEEDACYHCRKYLPNCKFCSDLNTCLKCDTGYVVGCDNKCIPAPTDLDLYYVKDGKYCKCAEKIENCERCYSDDVCYKCESPFYIFNDETGKCVNDTCTDGHCYTPDNGVNYYDCRDKRFNDVEFCDYCSNRETCNKCQNGYTFLDGDNTVCHKITDLGCTAYKVDDNNYKTCMKHCSCCTEANVCKACDEHYCSLTDAHSSCEDVANGQYWNDTSKAVCYKCSEHIKNCVFCKDLNNCRKCDDTYGLLEQDDGTIKCELLTILETDDYYQKGNIYYKCNKGVTHCSKCKSEKTCTVCENNWIILDDKEDECKELKDYENDNYYTTDEYKKKRYWSCNKNNVENCEKCKERETCTQCKSGYYFLDDNRKRCWLEKDIIDTCYIKDSQVCESCNIPLQKCDQCHKDNGKLVCDKCAYGYCRTDKNSQNCYDVSDGSYYWEEKDKMCYKCDSSLKGCTLCESKTKCLDCAEGYLLNTIKFFCKKKEIEHCKYYKWDGDDLVCRKCDSGYIILNEDETKCIPAGDYPNKPDYYCTEPDCSRINDCTKFGVPDCLECSNAYTCDKCKPNYLRLTNTLTCAKKEYPRHKCAEAYDEKTCTKCDPGENGELVYIKDGYCKNCTDIGCETGACDLMGRCVICPIKHCALCFRDYGCAYCDDGYLVQDYYGYCQEFPYSQSAFLGSGGFYLEIDLEVTFKILMITSGSISPFSFLGNVMSGTRLRQLEEKVEFNCEEDTTLGTTQPDGTSRVVEMKCTAPSLTANKDAKYTVKSISDIKSSDGAANLYNPEQILGNKFTKEQMEEAENGSMKLNTLTFETYNRLGCQKDANVTFVVIGTLARNVPSEEGVELEAYSPKAKVLCDMEVEGKIATFKCKVDAKLFNKDDMITSLIFADKPITLKSGNVLYPQNSEDTPIQDITPVCTGEEYNYPPDDCVNKKTNMGPIIGLIVGLVVVAAAGIAGVILCKKRSKPAI